MNRYYLFSIILFFSYFGQLAAQDTFSKGLSFNYPACVITSIEVTDSSYYASGVIADSIFPYNTGIVFSKFDFNGNLQQNSVLTDTSKTYESWKNALKTLPDGNLILAGFSSYQEGMLVKFTPEGDTLFVTEYMSPYFQENPWFVMRDLVPLPDGDFAFTAIIERENFDNDILLTRVDSTGQILWQKIFGEETDEAAHSLLATNDGGLLIGAGKAGLGLYMVKTDGDGETEWIYTAPVPLAQSGALELYQLPNDDFIISSARIMETPGGVLGINPFLFRLNSAMEWDWEVNFFDSLAGFDNILTKILPLPDNEHFLAAGSGFVTLSDGNQNVGKLIKASYQGDSIWTRYYHHTEKENARNLLYDLEATPDGGFIMCGQATGIENPSPENPNQQGWLLKVDEHGCLVPECHLASSTIDLQEVSFEIKTYPNPISSSSGDYLNVYFYHPKLRREAVFQLVDVLGKVVLEFKSQHGDITHMIPVSGLATGTYWLRCQVGDEIISKQVVIE
ncbi:MAG: hypothetical protein ACI9XB_004268 [Gammaproteobacteria bacterium]|jgi:hypothetical protein